MTWFMTCYECMGECCYFGDMLCSNFPFFLFIYFFATIGFLYSLSWVIFLYFKCFEKNEDKY